LSLPAFLVGVTRRLAGQAFRSNLFLRRKISKKGFPLQSLTQLELKMNNQSLKFF
jgi:hypothetical protein